MGFRVVVLAKGCVSRITLLRVATERELELAEEMSVCSASWEELLTSNTEPVHPSLSLPLSLSLNRNQLIPIQCVCGTGLLLIYSLIHAYI